MQTSLPQNTQNIQPSFTLREIKDRAFALTKKHWQPYVLLCLFGILAIAPFELARIAIEVNGFLEMQHSVNLVEQGSGMKIAAAFLGLLSMIIQMYFGIALTRYALAAAEDTSVPFARYFSWNTKTLLMMLGATILYFIAVFAGLVAFVIPGIILALGLSMYAYLLIDKNLTAIHALQQSWKLTKGNRGNIFLFSFLMFLAGTFAILLVPLIMGLCLLAIALVTQNAGYGELLFGGIIIGAGTAIWALIVSIPFGTFSTIASALMYKKMLETRNIE